MEIYEVVGLIAGAVGILAATAAVTRYFTRLQVDPRLAALEAVNAQTEAKYQDLLADVATAKGVGFAALFKKMEIDDELESLMELTNAESASILVPSPRVGTQPRPDQLVFLSVHGPRAHMLKRFRVPIDGSIAGDVFKRGTYDLATDAKRDSRHFKTADDVSGGQTEKMITYPLRSEERNVGVLQLLNKKVKGEFAPRDVEVVRSVVPRIASRVAEFTASPENFDILRISPERESEQACVLFCDLTNSASLFIDMTTSVAIDLINEYLEEACQVAMDLKGTIDEYLGDGVMLRFNVPRRVNDPMLAGLTCAIRIQEQFEALKVRWLKAGYPVHSVFSRVAVASGLVHRAVLGHPQREHVTIMGPPVNSASNLCEVAARDRSIILIDQRISAHLEHRLEARGVPSEKLGKAARYTPRAYEVLELRNP